MCITVVQWTVSGAVYSHIIYVTNRVARKTDMRKKYIRRPKLAGWAQLRSRF